MSRHVHHQRFAGINPATELIDRRDQLSQFQRQAPAGAQRRTVSGRKSTQRLVDLSQLVKLAAGLLPFLQTTQQGQVTQPMQHARAITALLVQVEKTGQGPRVFGGMQRQVPITLGVIRQVRVAEPRAALEGQPQNQVHALPAAQAMQGLGQGLHGSAAVLGGAVGGGDQHGGNLRIGTRFLFEDGQVKPPGVKAAFDRYLHIGHQWCTVSQRPSALQIHRQGHARRQGRHFTKNFLPGIKQQILQSLGQVFHVQRLGQVSRRRQR